MKSLICINTCNRLHEVKKFIWDYIDFCNKNDDFDFVLALDGYEQDYLDFCESYEIPLVYSVEREGVGLSKNRVLKLFPNYDYYFFIDDDVELIDDSVFQDFLNVSKAGRFHHLSANHPRSIQRIDFVNGYQLEFALYGGAYFNFFTAEGLKIVGGWNTCFSKYKRYGHTEHSYRYLHAGLSEVSFVSIVDARNKLILYNPPHVTEDNSEIDIESQLVREEKELISQKTSFFPIDTLSDYYFNGFNMSSNKGVGQLLRKGKRYPLTVGQARRYLLADHFFLKIRTTSNVALKLFWFLKSMFYNPLNVPFKHYVKTKLLKYV